jgi:hypothetical protein
MLSMLLDEIETNGNDMHISRAVPGKGLEPTED